MKLKQSINDGLLRLRQLKEITEAKGEEMAAERGRFEAIANNGPTRSVVADNLFQTPPQIASMMAERLADLIGPLEGKRICEPSAGLGRLISAAGVRGPEWVIVEKSPHCCRELYDFGIPLIQGDFLECTEERLGGKMAGFLMNPPFRRGLDIKFVLRCRELLGPGGAIVSLVANGSRQRKKLKPIADTWEVLPERSFHSEGTDVSVAMITIQNLEHKG